MNPHHGRGYPCPETPVTPVVLSGRAWTARRIRNNCLRQHCHTLAATFHDKNEAHLKPLCARVLLVLETRSRVLTDLHPNDIAIIASVVRFAAYADQWLRQPEDWQPDAEADARTQWASLLRHLLALYPVPAFLDAAWQTWGPLVHFERDCWCAIGYGRSLRMIDGMPKSVSQRVVHTALGTFEARGFREAIWLAQLRCLKASAALERAVMASRVPQCMSHHALWVRLIAKFSAHGDEFVTHFALVADTLVAVWAHRGPAQVEALLNLPARDLIRHCIKFVTQLMQANGHLLTEQQVAEAVMKAELTKLAASRWKPMLDGAAFTSKYGKVREHAPWQIEELCSVGALREEGKALSHCVAGYASRCRAGTSAIFSVRHHRRISDSEFEVSSIATIEVRTRTRSISQIKAYRNRPVNNTVMTIVREWSAAKAIEC